MIFYWNTKYLYFVVFVFWNFVFCSICILSHLYFVAFVFCYKCILAICILFFCILSCLYFDFFVVFCSVCIMEHLYFDWLPYLLYHVVFSLCGWWVGGIPIEYFVSTKLQLWLFCCMGCGYCWAVAITPIIIRTWHRTKHWCSALCSYGLI